MDPQPLETVLSVRVPLRLLSDPAPGGAVSAPILLGLHGYGLDADLLFPVLRGIAPEGALVISLEGPESALLAGMDTSDPRRGFHWGVSKRPEDNRAVHRAAVAEAVGWAAAHGGDPARVVLFGFSQPCSFNYRLALDPPHGHPFRAILAVCGGLPGEWTTEAEGTSASRSTDVLHVSTRTDAFYPLEKVAPYRALLASRFRTAGHLYYDGGHRVPSAAGTEMRAFLAARA